MDDIPKYQLRYFFEYGGPCLWSVNDAAGDRFGYCIDESLLPLSEATIRMIEKIGDWYSHSLNWDYPPNPGPWRQEECDRFNRATSELLAVIRCELGSEFAVDDQQKPVVEDPDLDAYLADPKGFRR